MTAGQSRTTPRATARAMAPCGPPSSLRSGGRRIEGWQLDGRLLAAPHLLHELLRGLIRIPAVRRQEVTHLVAPRASVAAEPLDVGDLPVRNLPHLLHELLR